MEEKFVNIYKCRLCGEIFSTRVIDEVSEVCFYLGRMCQQSKGEPTPYEHHVCENGDVGFADLMGFRKIKNLEKED